MKGIIHFSFFAVMIIALGLVASSYLFSSSAISSTISTVNWTVTSVDCDTLQVKETWYGSIEPENSGGTRGVCFNITNKLDVKQTVDVGFEFEKLEVDLLKFSVRRNQTYDVVNNIFTPNASCMNWSNATTPNSTQENRCTQSGGSWENTTTIKWRWYWKDLFLNETQKDSDLKYKIKSLKVNKSSDIVGSTETILFNFKNKNFKEGTFKFDIFIADILNSEINTTLDPFFSSSLTNRLNQTLNVPSDTITVFAGTPYVITPVNYTGLLNTSQLISAGNMTSGCYDLEFSTINNTAVNYQWGAYANGTGNLTNSFGCGSTNTTVYVNFSLSTTNASNVLTANFNNGVDTTLSNASLGSEVHLYTFADGNATWVFDSNRVGGGFRIPAGRGARAETTGIFDSGENLDTSDCMASVTESDFDRGSDPGITIMFLVKMAGTNGAGFLYKNDWSIDHNSATTLRINGGSPNANGGTLTVANGNWYWIFLRLNSSISEFRLYDNTSYIGESRVASGTPDNNNNLGLGAVGDSTCTSPTTPSPIVDTIIRYNKVLSVSEINATWTRWARYSDLYSQGYIEANPPAVTTPRISAVTEPTDPATYSFGTMRNFSWDIDNAEGGILTAFEHDSNITDGTLSNATNRTDQGITCRAGANSTHIRCWTQLDTPARTIDWRVTANKSTTTWATAVSGTFVVNAAGVPVTIAPAVPFIRPYPMAVDITASESNSGDGGCTYSFWVQSSLGSEPAILIGTGSSVTDTALRGASTTISWRYNNTACANYTSSFTTREDHDITQGNPLGNMSVYLPGVAANTNTSRTYIGNSYNFIGNTTGLAGDPEPPTFTFYRNGTSLGTGNVTSTVSLGAGAYDFNITTPGNANWSANGRSNIIFTVDRGDLRNNVSIFIDNSRANLTIPYGLSRTAVVNMTFNNTGANDLVAHLYRNDTNFTLNNNTATTFDTGNHIFRGGTTQGTLANFTVSNYSSGVLTVTAGIQTNALSVTPATPITYNILTTGTCTTNSTDTSQYASLWRNVSSAINNNVTAAENNTGIRLNATIFLYTCNSTATANFSSSSVTATYTINKAALENNVTVSIDLARANKTITYGTFANASVVFNGSGGSDLVSHLYLNDTNFTTNNDTQFIFASGSNQFRGGTTQGTLNNYTVGNYSIAILTVNTNSSVGIDLYLNGTLNSDRYYRNNTIVNITARSNVTDLTVELGGNYTGYGIVSTALFTSFNPSSATTVVENISTTNNFTNQIFNISGRFLGNANYSASALQTRYLLLDVLGPQVRAFSFNDSYININQTILIEVNATANNNESSNNLMNGTFNMSFILVEINRTGGTRLNLSLTRQSSLNFTGSFSSTELGTVQQNATIIGVTNIYTNDSANNSITNSTSLPTFDYARTILANLTDTPDPATNGTGETFTATAQIASTENSRLSGATVTFQFNGTNYTMSYISASDFHRAIVPSTVIAAVYNYTVYFENNSFQTQTATGTIEIKSGIGGPGSSPGGGGGGGGETPIPATVLEKDIKVNKTIFSVSPTSVSEFFTQGKTIKKIFVIDNSKNNKQLVIEGYFSCPTITNEVLNTTIVDISCNWFSFESSTGALSSVIKFTVPANSKYSIPVIVTIPGDAQIERKELAVIFNSTESFARSVNFVLASSSEINAFKVIVDFWNYEIKKFPRETLGLSGVYGSTIAIAIGSIAMTGLMVWWLKITIFPQRKRLVR